MECLILDMEYWNEHNRDPMLLKSIDGDIVYILGGSRTYQGPRLRCLALNQTVPSGTIVQ